MSQPTAKWMELCTALGGDHGLIEEVLCAVEDRQHYAVTYAELLDHYRPFGLVDHIRERQWPWLALLAGLSERGLAWDFSPADEAEEIAGALAQLRQVAGLDLKVDWFIPVEEDEWYAEEEEYPPPPPTPAEARARRLDWFFHHVYDASRELAKHGLGFLVIELEPWLLPTTIVPLDRRMHIGGLITDLGGVAKVMDFIGLLRITADGVLVRPDGTVISPEADAESLT